jgi:hypothetical protein
MDSPTRILVSRLERLWDPYAVLDMSPRDFLGLEGTQPKSRYVSELSRTGAYHRGRVRYFVDCLRAGEDLDPIEIDNLCSGFQCYPIPVVIDGNHRLIAHLILQRDTIPATYGGRLDLFDYLQGDREDCPEE